MDWLTNVDPVALIHEIGILLMSATALITALRARKQANKNHEKIAQVENKVDVAAATVRKFGAMRGVRIGETGAEQGDEILTPDVAEQGPDEGAKG